MFDVSIFEIKDQMVNLTKLAKRQGKDINNWLRLKSTREFLIACELQSSAPHFMHRHKTRAKAFLEKEYPGIKHIKGSFKQNRFLYILNKKIKKQYVAISI
jgi:uncharacterized FlgJ-related protein